MQVTSGTSTPTNRPQQVKLPQWPNVSVLRISDDSAALRNPEYKTALQEAQMAYQTLSDNFQAEVNKVLPSFNDEQKQAFKELVLQVNKALDLSNFERPRLNDEMMSHIPILTEDFIKNVILARLAKSNLIRANSLLAKV